MFVDNVKIKLQAGKGGNGVVAWRREKSLPKGGPYGGNGGKGGSITFLADPSLFSLEPYRHKRLVKAEHGQAGGTNRQKGRSGKNLTLKVPYGTLIKDPHTGKLLHDFTPQAATWDACKGGLGGRGNVTFKTSTNRAPNQCTPGRGGEELEIELELKLIADVGLIGMPNAGKSTLLGALTTASAKVGAYPFTTLSPNLSYIQSEDFRRVFIADIPGIIEGAHKSRGLGLEFLKHVERTNLLIYVLDCGQIDGRSPLEDFAVLQEEIRAYNEDILKKPFAIALNKIDTLGAEEQIKEFRQTFKSCKYILEISALEGAGLLELNKLLFDLCLPQIAKREYYTAQ